MKAKQTKKNNISFYPVVRKAWIFRGSTKWLPHAGFPHSHPKNSEESLLNLWKLSVKQTASNSEMYEKVSLRSSPPTAAVKEMNTCVYRLYLPFHKNNHKKWFVLYLRPWCAKRKDFYCLLYMRKALLCLEGLLSHSGYSQLPKNCYTALTSVLRAVEISLNCNKTDCS